MTTITFSHGPTREVALVQVNESDDTVFAGTGHDMDVYAIHDIKSIIPPKAKEVPTVLQTSIMTCLDLKAGYRYDKQHSISAAGVVLKRVSDGDFWFFGLEGEIMHNPEAFLSIKL